MRDICIKDKSDRKSPDNGAGWSHQWRNDPSHLISAKSGNYPFNGNKFAARISMSTV